MLQYWIWFAENQDLELSEKRQLLEYFSDPEDICYAKGESLEEDLSLLLKKLQNRDVAQAEEILRLCRRKNIRVLTYGDAQYPRRLRAIEDPPLVLYYRGVLPDFDSVPAIGVVGTRKATAYGLSIARRLSSQIAACGGLVISGGASGIDAVAMQGALTQDCPVVGVLGCGVDVVYPKSNRQLFSAVAEEGCLLSEYPPGTPGLPWHFPRRNRIISGLSKGVLVVEAPEKSGALITARLAFEQGRDVFVVPGNIDVAACAGSNALLQERALAVFSGWDILREYESLYPGKLERREPAAARPQETGAVKVAEEAQLPRDTAHKSVDKKENCPYSGIKNTVSQFSEEEQALLKCIGPEPRPVDEVIAIAQLSPGKVLGLLTVLAIRGAVEHHPGNRVSLKI